MSGDPEQDYFSDGITEDIIAELSRFGTSLSSLGTRRSNSAGGRMIWPKWQGSSVSSMLSKAACGRSEAESG